MCFSWLWIRDILIWLVVIGAAIAVLKILVPMVLAWVGAELGAGVGVIMQVVKIVISAAILIFVIQVCFELISCLLGYGGGSLMFPRRP